MPEPPLGRKAGRTLRVGFGFLSVLEGCNVGRGIGRGPYATSIGGRGEDACE